MFAEAAWNAPVGIQTITGAAVVGAGPGVQMFNFRQSSLPAVPVVAGGLIRGQLGGAVMALSVAGAQDAAGCGGFQRRLPTGGAANGIPRNAQDEPRSTPRTSPLTVVTRHEDP